MCFTGTLRQSVPPERNTVDMFNGLGIGAHIAHKGSGGSMVLPWHLKHWCVCLSIIRFSRLQP